MDWSQHFHDTSSDGENEDEWEVVISLSNEQASDLFTTWWEVQGHGMFTDWAHKQIEETQDESPSGL